MIALDLDNTIICYDEAFRAAAKSIGCLPPSGVRINKASVKASAHKKGGNELWTALQGIVYGEEIEQAEFFPGCIDFIDSARMRNEKLVVLSHKTEFPAIGPKVNLRTAAIQWLSNRQFDPHIPLIFCDSREEKVSHLKTLGCHALVDDLPEVFQTTGFPNSTRFVLFDSNNTHGDWSISSRVTSWRGAADLLLPPTNE